MKIMNHCASQTIVFRKFRRILRGGGGINDSYIQRVDFTAFSSSRLEMTANLVEYSRASKEFSLLEEIFFPRARNDRIFLEDSSKDSLIVTSLTVNRHLLKIFLYGFQANGQCR